MRTLGFATVLSAVLHLICGCTVNSPPFYEKQVSERLVVAKSEEAQKQHLVRREKCTIEFLRKYAHSELIAARILVADNPGADEQIRNELSKDRSDEVRASVASSQYTPRWLLLELLLDKSSHVRYCLATNGHLTQDEIRALFFSYEDPPLMAFALNLNLPEEIREHILKSDDEVAKMTLNRPKGWQGRGVEIQQGAGTKLPDDSQSH